MFSSVFPRLLFFFCLYQTSPFPPHTSCCILIYICMQNHNDDTIKTSGHSSLEKYTSHFIRKSSKGLLKVLLWEGLGDRTELQHIDPHSYGHNSVSFPFSWAAQPEAHSAGCWFSLPHLISTGWTFCARSYIIVRHHPSSCGRHKSHSFNPSTVKVIFWYSSTGCTCYLHWCISYFDCPAGSEVNIQHSASVRCKGSPSSSWRWRRRCYRWPVDTFISVGLLTGWVWHWLGRRGPLLNLFGNLSWTAKISLLGFLI